MREGSLGAPTRNPIDWRNPSFVNEADLDKEMRRQFEICHGCRRCFNLCESFPRLFDLIDEKEDEELQGVASSDFKQVVDGCTLCDMCFLTKCPYVPPHEFNIDFPHLMLRYRAFEKAKGKIKFFDQQITEIDRNGKIISAYFSKIVNWLTDKKNSLMRMIIQFIVGIDKNVELPKFNASPFLTHSKIQKRNINTSAPAYGKKAIVFATCFVNYNEPSIGKSALKVLAFNGIETETVYPRCCGMPQLEQGDIKRVASNALLTVKEMLPFINNGLPIISLIPSCTLMMKSEWPLILPENEDIKKLSKSVLDISEYIMKLKLETGLADGLKKLDEAVTLHLSCHSRAQNIGSKGAEMLRMIPDTKVNVVERCSGHGGSWGVKKENFVGAMKFAKGTIRKINSAKAKHTCSECPLAAKHLSQGLIESNASNFNKEKTLHPIQLFSKAYGLEK